MSWLFESDGQSIRASALVLPMNIQDSFPLGLTGLISLQSKGLLQHVRKHLSILQHSAFFIVQLTSIRLYWKNHSFDYMDLCQQGNVSAL